MLSTCLDVRHIELSWYRYIRTNCFIQLSCLFDADLRPVSIIYVHTNTWRDCLVSQVAGSVTVHHSQFRIRFPVSVRIFLAFTIFIWIFVIMISF